MICLVIWSPCHVIGSAAHNQSGSTTIVWASLTGPLKMQRPPHVQRYGGRCVPGRRTHPATGGNGAPAAASAGLTVAIDLLPTSLSGLLYGRPPRGPPRLVARRSSPPFRTTNIVDALLADGHMSTECKSVDDTLLHRDSPRSLLRRRFGALPGAWRLCCRHPKDGTTIAVRSNPPGGGPTGGAGVGASAAGYIDTASQGCGRPSGDEEMEDGGVLELTRRLSPRQRSTRRCARGAAAQRTTGT